MDPAQPWSSRRSGTAVLLYRCAEKQTKGASSLDNQLTLLLCPVCQGQAIIHVFFSFIVYIYRCLSQILFENPEGHQTLHVLWSQPKDSQHSPLQVNQTTTLWPCSAVTPAYPLSVRAETQLSAAAAVDVDTKKKNLKDKQVCALCCSGMHTGIRSTLILTTSFH